MTRQMPATPSIFACLLVFLVLFTPLSMAQWQVPEGGGLDLGDGSIELGGSKLEVLGELHLGNGSLAGIGDLLIEGSVAGGFGQLTVTGNWINRGQFNAGQSLVEFRDGMSNTALLEGDSGFARLDFDSATGRTYVIESGRTISIQQELIIRGRNGVPLQIASSNPPEIAEMVLSDAGMQDIEFVGVSNVHATGQHLAPDQTNQGGSGNDRGWFGNFLNEFSQIVPVPFMAPASIALMVLLILVVTWLRVRRHSPMRSGRA